MRPYGQSIELLSPHRNLTNLAPGFLGLLGGDYVYRPSESKHWYEYAQAPDAIHQCAARLGLTDAEMALAIADKLMPPNWAAFFWMGSYYEAMQGKREMLELAMQRHKQADEAAVARQRREAAAAAGALSGAARRNRARVSADEVQVEWEKLLSSHNERSIAGVLAKRFNVDPSYIRKLKKAKRD